MCFCCEQCAPDTRSNTFHTDASAGCIQAEGVQQFCQDLDVDPMDIITVCAKHAACAMHKALVVVVRGLGGIMVMGREDSPGMVCISTANHVHTSSGGHQLAF